MQRDLHSYFMHHPSPKSHRAFGSAVIGNIPYIRPALSLSQIAGRRIRILQRGNHRNHGGTAVASID